MLFGLISIEHAALEPGILKSFASSLKKNKDLTIHAEEEGRYLLGRVTGFSSRDEFFIEDEDSLILGQGRIDNQVYEEDANGNPHLNIKSLSSLLLDKPSALRGDFILFFLQKKNNSSMLIRDQLGLRPVYYLQLAENYFFSNSLKFFNHIHGYKPEIDPVWIADSLATMRSETFRTPYLDIKKLQPGHILSSRGSDFFTQPYWNFERDIYPGNNHTEHFRELLFQAVERRIGKNRIVASELSGGLDSSTISAIASTFCKGKKNALYFFSHQLPDDALDKHYPFSDEREYTAELLPRLGTGKHIIIDSQEAGLIELIKRNILIQGGPTQSGYHILSDKLYKEAGKLDVEVLLSGFGGDEGVSGSYAGLREELLSKKEWKAYADYFIKDQRQGGKERIKLLLFRFLPLSKRILLPRKVLNPAFSQKYEILALNKDFEKELRLKKRYKKQKTLQRPSDLKNSMVLMLSRSGLSQRMEFSWHAAQEHQLSYAYPLLDLDLLNFFYNLTWDIKTHPGQSRYLLRDVMKEILPERIYSRSDKSGSTIPATQYLIWKEQSNILSLIEESEMRNQFHYLDYNRMKLWLSEIVTRTNAKARPVNPLAFINSLQVLILQEMQRSGEFDSGIKC